MTASEIVVAATGHTLTKVAAKEASYTAASNVEHYACACGALFTDAEGKTATTAEAVVIPQLIKIEENTAKVEDSAVDAAIEEAIKESTSSDTTTEETKLEVVIKVEDAKTEENKEEITAVEQVELPVKALDKVAEKEADLVVVLPNAKVTVNTEALEAVSKQAEGEKVSLVVKEVKTETLTAAQKKTVEKLEVAVTITAELICQKTGEKIWTEDTNKAEKTGNIKVEIPFTPAAGTKGSDYTVVYIDDNGNATKVNTTFVNNCLVFELEHFSDYVIINETKTPLVETPETGDETRLVLLLSVMVLSIVGVVSMAVLSKKSRYVPKYMQK